MFLCAHFDLAETRLSARFTGEFPLELVVQSKVLVTSKAKRYNDWRER